MGFPKIIHILNDSTLLNQSIPTTPRKTLSYALIYLNDLRDGSY